MKQLIALYLLMFVGNTALAQYNETIRTARPGQAVGPFTTGKDVFQIQTGLNYGDFEDDDNSETGNNATYTASLRYGLLENFEIRSAFSLRSDEVIQVGDQTDNFGGLSFWNVGIRYNIIDGGGYKPSFGFQTDVRLTWVDEAYQSEEIAPRMMLIHGQRLSETFVLTTNWAIAWNGNDNQPKGTYVVNISFPIAGKWSSFIENYGEVVGDDFDTRWDTGLAYLVNNDFQLDVSGGFGKNEGLTDWFIDGGISWRVKFK